MRWVTLANGQSVCYALPNDPVVFPPIEYALQEPNGLIMAGGALTSDWLIAAYQRGIFPWFSNDEPILWWSPNPRTVLIPSEFKQSRSLRKTIRNSGMSVSHNTAFAQVIRYCAHCHGETWIVDAMIQAYEQLHQLGYAHSIEVWYEQQLVGGLYGVAIQNVFFGESMFSLKSNASKVALAHLCSADYHFQLIDCQFATSHLLSLGAKNIERSLFLHMLAAAIQPQHS